MVGWSTVGRAVRGADGTGSSWVWGRWIRVQLGLGPVVPGPVGTGLSRDRRVLDERCCRWCRGLTMAAGAVNTAAVSATAAPVMAEAGAAGVMMMKTLRWWRGGEYTLVCDGQ